MKISSFGLKHRSLSSMTLELGFQTKYFDCRNLPNPYLNSALKHKTGMNASVQEWIRERGATEFNRLLSEAFALAKSGKDIAFYCIGGSHRSVAMAEALYNKLCEEAGEFDLTHYELHLSRKSMGANI